jgi:hypothetical protein
LLEGILAVLFHRRVQFAELLNDGSEKIELAFRKLEDLHSGLLFGY